jgi:alkaline phosphatase
VGSTEYGWQNADPQHQTLVSALVNPILSSKKKMNKNTHRLSALVFSLLTAVCCLPVVAQKYAVGKNAHSHNDYLQSQPFYTAHSNGFASMEIDVFQVGNALYVAHKEEEIDQKLTIESLYLEPLLRQIKLNGNNKAYKDGGKLQFMIDLKTSGPLALKCLEAKLKPIRQYFDVANNPDAVKLVITGDTPAPQQFDAYDKIFFFDGKRSTPYTPEQMKRVAFFSANFQDFSHWNGLGRMVGPDSLKAKNFVDSVHQVGKPVRFWGNPDSKTCWQAFMKMGVDYLNTDSPAEMAKFLNKYADNTYTATAKHAIYTPTFKTDNGRSKPKNVILLISDGSGFSSFWAAATANGGYLNATNIKHVGFSNTAAANDYTTDSAAGATAMATGEKTNNRYIGMDANGKEIPNLPERLDKLGIRSGIVSNDRVPGATPASFFAHRTERDQSDSIASDLSRSPVSLVIAGYHNAFGANQDAILNRVKASGFAVYKGLENLPKAEKSKKVLVFDNDRPAEQFRMIEKAFDESVKFLSADNKKGFFLMVEGAKIDAGGHTNKLNVSIDEYLSFDRVIGKALEYADKDGETLVIITSDHETGGLIVLDGNYKSGSVMATYTTNDHTGLPVPLLSYGPGADQFTGFLQNTDIPKRVLELLK